MNIETYEKTLWINDVRVKVIEAEESFKQEKYIDMDSVISKIRDKYGILDHHSSSHI